MDNGLIDDGNGQLSMELLDQIRQEIAGAVHLLIANHGKESADQSEAGVFLFDSPIGTLELSFALSRKDAPTSFHNVLPKILKLLRLQREIRLWLINDAYWYAADSKEAAVAQFAKDQRWPEGEPVEALPVSDEDLDEFIFEEDDESAVTFRHHLNFLIFNGDEFPREFAFKA